MHPSEAALKRPAPCIARCFADWHKSLGAHRTRLVGRGAARGSLYVLRQSEGSPLQIQAELPPEIACNVPDEPVRHDCNINALDSVTTNVEHQLPATSVD